MTDIVQRAREEAEACNDIGGFGSTAAVLRDAADEIERLREALRAVVDGDEAAHSRGTWRTFDDWAALCHAYDDALDAARVLLAEGTDQ